mmetsp:Transcript_292/g.1027  ORF Transcript_292/g.1027 Transcript_292/m.1027 type:complete len:470 (-) Transcript_292:78-1487(-)
MLSAADSLRASAREPLIRATSGANAESEEDPQTVSAAPLPADSGSLVGAFPDFHRGGHWLCSGILFGSCCVATMCICSDALAGVRRSFYCRLGSQTMLAPLGCVAPLAAAAILCHSAVLFGLLCVARFAWRSFFLAAERLSYIAATEALRSEFQMDLRLWRRVSSRILLAAGGIYLLAGTPCAGFARLAFVFLASGFLTLYATALFFDDDVEQVQLTSRMMRFLGVYMLMGMTFSGMTIGVTERYGDAKMRHHSEDSCGLPIHGHGREKLAPLFCTVPLDFVFALSLWWAGSPLFAAVFPEQRYSSPGAGPSGAKYWRRVLQRWSRRVDLIVSLVGVAVLLFLDVPCRHSAPMSWTYAQIGAVCAILCATIRRMYPSCDGWRGPLEHLPSIRGPHYQPAQCSVCLSAFAPGDDVCRTRCRHDFHRDCLEEWVLAKHQRAGSCPLCRRSLRLPDDAECLNQGCMGPVGVM